VILVDQLTKWWAVEALSDGPIDLVWTLRLRVIRNFGGSFGVGQGRGAVISIIGIAVIIGLLWAATKPRPTASIVALGFFIGGAAGNIIDRVVRAGEGLFGGGVVDFIDFQWWPVFNVADISLYVGVGLLLLVGLGEPADPPPDD
jgi:signal peptidase II